MVRQADIQVTGKPSSRQQGAVLVVALIILILLTLLGVAAANRSLLQERMAGSLRNAQLAEMGAEAALRGAEWRLWTASVTASNLRCGTDILTDCYPYDPSESTLTPVGVFRNSTGWIAGYGTEYNTGRGGMDFTNPSTNFANAALARNPRYVIEDLGPELPSGTMGQHESGATGTDIADYGSTTRHVYRITARSTGGSEDMVRVLESTFSAKGD
ncbi:MAG TPA: PilX N-terminal domain-containing pilus assembly protein [Dyella sp.]|uniref:pilus assembly PilX family protein n=1 Tax=Dyella sp. TaxID=1869338 RepID=UPI002D772A31|nr:PilX N-terminal domain-containing pilus assembly protein [Dyella sp.]HET6553362.1 PilX N-terminal domain-containing pilus assembly protein [Dyella sp.]